MKINKQGKGCIGGCLGRVGGKGRGGKTKIHSVVYTMVKDQHLSIERPSKYRRSEIWGRIRTNSANKEDIFVNFLTCASIFQAEYCLSLQVSPPARSSLPSILHWLLFIIYHSIPPPVSLAFKGTKSNVFLFFSFVLMIITEHLKATGFFFSTVHSLGDVTLHLLIVWLDISKSEG